MPDSAKMEKCRLPANCRGGTLGLRQPRPGAWGHRAGHSAHEEELPSIPSPRTLQSAEVGTLVRWFLEKSQKTLRFRSIVGTSQKMYGRSPPLLHREDFRCYSPRRQSAIQPLNIPPSRTPKDCGERFKDTATPRACTHHVLTQQNNFENAGFEMT